MFCKIKNVVSFLKIAVSLLFLRPVDNKYLLLTEFEGCTVSYGPSFFPHRFMAQVPSAQAINQREKQGSVTFSMDQENEVSKIFIISLLCV